MKYLYLVLLLCFAYCSHAQESTVDSKLQAYYQQQFTENVKKQLDKIDWSHVQRTTGNDTIQYTIPVVVHVLYNYAHGWVSDTAIINCIQRVNTYLLKQNADTAQIIDKYKSVAASTQIRLKLATIDPAGNPTKGIDRIHTYLTSNATDQSKLNQWPPDRYLNIWTAYELNPGFTHIVYSPAEVVQIPYYDGALCYASSFAVLPSYVAQLFCRYMGLLSPCAINTCGDDDLIPDTPPCSNIELTAPNIYDTLCDTPNMQNIMFDNGLGTMLTYGQGQYLQSVLQQNIAQRDSLITSTTQTLTGMDLPMPDLPPIADFSTGVSQFFWPGQEAIFHNYSWNDTISAAQWFFSGSAAIVASNDLNVNNSFSNPGWDSATLTVTGNNTGQSSITKPFFIADTNATNAQGYYQEFNPDGDLNKWPIFNYYNNNYKWQTANVGYYDNTSMEYHVYDTRSIPSVYTGTSNGDMDDMISPVFDLSSFSDTCSLIFYSSGAYRTTANTFFDKLAIDYTINGLVWTRLKVLARDSIDNKGLQVQDYIPQTSADWRLQSIPLPANARKNKVAFRFRYLPGADTVISIPFTGYNASGYSASNNFYMDRISFTAYPASVNNVAVTNTAVSLYPNPATTFVNVNITEPQVIGNYLMTITDVTGKETYQLQNESADNNTTIHLLLNKFVAGLYIVNVKTSRQSVTQKLIIN